MYYILFVSLFVGVFGQLNQNHLCTVPTNVATLDILKLLNTWYEIERIPSTNEQGDCVTTSFALGPNNTGIITKLETVKGKINKKVGTITMSVTDLAAGRFIIDFNENSTYDYYVLATDYTKYALLYTCKDDVNSTSNVWAWKLSRTTTLDANSTLEIDSVLQTSYPELKNSTWRVTKQNGCNGSTTIIVSPVLALIAIYFAGKEFF